MKLFLTIIILCLSLGSFSQEQDKQKLLAEKKANNYIYEGNKLVNDDFVSAEMEYRKALSKQSDNVFGIYNLAHSYYKNGNVDEALYRNKQTAKMATSKEAKHKAFHNIGNILMETKECKKAVEAYKNALRNNPNDNETRYNLGIAKACAEEQEKQEKNDDKDKQNEDKDNKDQKDDKNKEDDKKEDKNEGDDKKDDKNKEGEDKEDKKDEGDDKNDKNKKPDDKKNNDKGKGGDKDKKQPKPQPKQGQLSPQQIKSLLEAMNNQEQKVQEKINAKKQKGIKIKTEKDW